MNQPWRNERLMYLMPSTSQTSSLERMDAEIDQLLLDGTATTMHEAENQFLDSHLDDIARLMAELRDSELLENPVVQLLLSHGSRSWEDGRL